MTDYDAEIVAAAERFKLSPRLLAAQVLVESSGRADAFRYEPGIAQQLAAGRLKPKYLPKNVCQRRLAGSYGLLQVLWLTAADYGFIGEPEMLFVPTIGLEYGAEHFAALLEWAGGDYGRALAAFNGGKSGNVSPPFRNQAYATRVFEMEKTLT
jgi:hypothetical protein